MTDLSSKWLVETEWLHERLSSPGLVIIDASWTMPGEPRTGGELYREAHIPGALFFDIDEIADTSSSLPHMLPAPEKFSSRMHKMGVGDGMKIVVYDNRGLFSAPRVWWNFRVMGHDDVVVLNGGLVKWSAEGRPMEPGTPAPRQERHFTTRRNAELVRDIDDVKAAIEFRASRSSMRGPRRASMASRGSRARRPGSAICQALATCPSDRSSIRTARLNPPLSCAPFSRGRALIPASPPSRAAGRALRLACWR